MPSLKNLQKCHFSPIHARFSAKTGATTVFGRSRHFSPGTPSFNAELQTCVGILEKNVRGAEIWGRSCGVCDHNGSKIRVWGAKKVENFCPQKFSIPLLDSKFDVEFDFVINHDPIP